jgi:hypothetical protein
MEKSIRLKDNSERSDPVKKSIFHCKEGTESINAYVHLYDAFPPICAFASNRNFPFCS